jgi:endonuclease YncB( thermonuclease family)
MLSRSIGVRTGVRSIAANCRGGAAGQPNPPPAFWLPKRRGLDALLSLREPHTIQRRLTDERTNVCGQLEVIARERDEVIRQGARSKSESAMHAFALIVRLLDRKAAGLSRILELLDRQSQLLSLIVYARELNDRAAITLLDRFHLPDLIAPMGNVLATTEAVETCIEMVGDALDRVASGLAKSYLTLRPNPSREFANVKSVPDGDGVKLDDRRRVRYLGIDAPEISTRDGPPEPFAEEARALNRELVAGKRVRLLRDTSDTDPYGRLLRYVYVDDTFVNAELVRAGLAVAFPIAPDLAHADTFERLERDARRRRRGMWKTRIG